MEEGLFAAVSDALYQRRAVGTVQGRQRFGCIRVGALGQIGLDRRQRNRLGLFKRCLVRGRKRQLKRRLAGCSVEVVDVAEVGMVIETVGSA